MSMGKSVTPCSAINSQDCVRIITSDALRRPKHINPPTRNPPGQPNSGYRGIRSESLQFSLNLNARAKMEASPSGKKIHGPPLSEVVADCVERWFDETLIQAEGGDRRMQGLVGQMYCYGYGVKTDLIEGRRWLSKACESGGWVRVCKHPGYNSGDPDTSDVECS